MLNDDFIGIPILWELLPTAVAEEEEAEGEAQDHCAAESRGRIGESQHQVGFLRGLNMGGGDANARIGVAARGTARVVPPGMGENVLIHSSFPMGGPH